MASTGLGMIGKLPNNMRSSRKTSRESCQKLIYAAYEGKLRTFAESDNLMRDKVMNRGFYASKGRFKGKKGKPRPSSSTSSSKGKGGAAMAADAMATVGSPNYSGCFTCGSRDHEFRNCPKKSSNKAGKGGGIYMVSSMTSASAENIYAAPVEAYGQNVPGTMPSLIGHVQQPDLEGFAVLDTGATETITSLEALEFVLNKRRQRFGEERLQVVDRPQKFSGLEMGKRKHQRALY